MASLFIVQNKCPKEIAYVAVANTELQTGQTFGEKIK